MITAGCDVGSLTSKAVVLKGNRILGSAVIRSRTRPEAAARQVFDEALAAAGIEEADVACCLGTGYGMKKIPFVSGTKSEIACHAAGARFLAPSAMTVIDIGGQDCKATRMDKEGNVERFLANDKCAAGTGRFLEVMAKILDVTLDELGALSKKARAPVTLASTCTVWAQADVIQYLNSGETVQDVGAGVNNAMAARVATLANSVGMAPDVCMTGGVAKNQGVVRALEKLLSIRIVIPRKADPQLAGAIGAAILARKAAEGKGA
ncbi:MAG: 2-hydroxyglutaryl-CoA dehydratase [Deltaproteobacteria bacterium]|nr:2-hydroxyglutaryl-CoA dehydratase [Deltaproteobacteria bacterium]